MLTNSLPTLVDNAASECTSTPVIGPKLWRWQSLAAERNSTVCRRKPIDWGPVKVRKMQSEGREDEGKEGNWTSEKEIKRFRTSHERGGSEIKKERNQRDQQGAGQGPVLHSPVFKGCAAGMQSPAPVSQGHASLENKHPALPMQLLICSPLHVSPPPLSPETISYLQRIFYRHSSTSAIRTSFQQREPGKNTSRTSN